MLNARLFYESERQISLRFHIDERKIDHHHPIFDQIDSDTNLSRYLRKKKDNQYEYTFHFKHLEHVCHFINKESYCDITPLPEFVHKMLKKLSPVTMKKIETFDKIYAYHDRIKEKIPEETRHVLFDYQYQTLLYAQLRPKILIADDPGLGKTLQSICISALFPEQWPILIVCPSSVKKMWSNEYIKWLGYDKGKISIIDGKKTLIKDINIVSYGQVHKVESYPFNFIICDESHSIKTYNSKRTLTLSPLLKKAKHVLLLSGTPALSNALELFTQICILFGIYINYHDYASRYAHKRIEFNRVEYYGYKELDELHNILNESVMVRRNKSDIITNIPEKSRHKIYLELTDEKMKEFNDLKDELQQNENVYTKKYDMMALFRKIGELKSDGIIQYFSDHNVYNDKIIIFAHHLSILDRIEEELNKGNIRYISIRGSTKSSDRQGLIDDYQNPEKNIQVALLSITAAGVGVTLTAAKKVYFTELFWTPGLLLQAEDRAHRHGQLDKVNIYYMVAKDTVDDSIWRTIMSKMKFCTNTFDGKEKSLQIDSVIRDISLIEKQIPEFFLQNTNKRRKTS